MHLASIAPYLDTLSIVGGTLGVLYILQALRPTPTGLLQGIVAALPYGVIPGAALYCLNLLTNLYYTRVLSEVLGIPIPALALGVYMGLVGFFGAYFFGQVLRHPRQERSQVELLQLATFAALGSIVSSWFTVGVLNTRFHWFSGNLLVIIGVAYVLIGAVAAAIRQYRQPARRQALRQRVRAIPDPPEAGEANPAAARRYQASFRPRTNLPTRLYMLGRLGVALATLYASVSLFGFVILLYGLAMILIMLAVFIWQRRVIARLPKAPLASIAILLLVVAGASQVFRVFG